MGRLPPQPQCRFTMMAPTPTLPPPRGQAQHGFDLHHSLERSLAFGWLTKQPHMCCSFVLQRRGLPQLPLGIDAARAAYLRRFWWPGNRP